MKTRVVYVKKLAIVIVFSALGVILASGTWFEFLGTKAYPGQHMINAILGVLLGPLWTAVAAIFIGIIRNVLGMGTLYAFPGGIPGGIVVGVVYSILKRLKVSEKTRLASALSEPIGTLLIGVPLSLLVFAPWLGTEKILSPISREGFIFAFLILGAGWALSCVPGSIIGFIILLILNRAGINRKTLFGER